MRHRVIAPLIAVLLVASANAQNGGQAAIVYTVSFSAPEHHVGNVEVTFTNVPSGTLQARMSRSSPGRYAIHEFAKNVYDVRAFDGKGKALTFTRPNPYQWDISGHDGTVRVTYQVFGDLVDGTYLGIDSSHAHMNMPATLMWARRMEDRPVRVTFAPPAGSGWKPATQLFPTSDPWTFTAPNLQYLFDSPTELSAYTLKEFGVSNPDGKTFSIRIAAHTDPARSASEVDEYAAGVQRIVKEARTVFGEYPQFDTGTYTFLADYLPTNAGDGMEHRNSTVVSGRGSIRGGLGTASHEFFHCWNVERIRPQGLEPFNFEEANLTDSLWVAEGFTQYYGTLIMGRAGLSTVNGTVGNLANAANTVINSSGRQFRSPVEMSHHAPFTDAARAVDPTNFGITFISYYTYGAAVALGLDLTLRDRTDGKVTLDDFMRAMWRAHGKPGGPQPGLVAKPYSLTDLRDRLAEVSGDRAFADDFFTRYMIGREVVDYARLLQRAGVVLRKRNPGRAWAGTWLNSQEDPTRISNLQQPGTPAYEAGIEQGDQITSIDGKAIASNQQALEAIGSRKPGDTITVGYKRRSGAARTTTMVLKEDPTLEAVLLEQTGGTPTAAQQAFRNKWLGSQQR
jgi:predicted metalloprotease with PDZ domain